MEPCTNLGLAAKQYEFTTSISSPLDYTRLGQSELFDRALQH